MRTNEKVDFSKFGKSFQEKLCQLILHDRPFSDQIGEVLDYSFFELKHLQVFARKVYDYKKDYSVHPTVDIMTTVLRTTLDEENDAPWLLKFPSRRVRLSKSKLLTFVGNNASKRR